MTAVSHAGIRAVTFDYWRTLVYEDPGDLQRCRIDAIQDALSGHAEIPRTVLEAAHEHAFSRASPSWARNEQFTAEHAVDEMIAHAGDPRLSDLRAQLVDAFIEGGRLTPLHVVDGAARALTQLRDAGIRIGIICDVGLTPSTVLRWHLESRGLLDFFDDWSFSDEVGVYKPDLRIFQHAAERLHVDPGQAAHVGDQRRTDVAGALAAGWLAVRFRGVFDDMDETQPEAAMVLDSLEELPGRLGVA